MLQGRLRRHPNGNDQERGSWMPEKISMKLMRHLLDEYISQLEYVAACLKEIDERRTELENRYGLPRIEACLTKKQIQKIVALNVSISKLL